jgi:hypothetical protein
MPDKYYQYVTIYKGKDSQNYYLKDITNPYNNAESVIKGLRIDP